MSTDPKLFQAPESYPEPPKNMYYQVPSTPPASEPPKPIFPWEHNQAKPTRIFADDLRPSSSESAPSVTTDASTQAQTASPTTPTVQVTSSEPLANFSWTNAWDEMPEIERHIANLPHNRRRAQVQVLLHNKMPRLAKPDTILSPNTQSPDSKDSPPLPESQERRPSLRLTDFPSEIERPSLPVTPTPVRRPSFWGQERDAAGVLPPAEGVPDQADWEPMAKLIELQRRQSEVLAAGPTSPRRDIPDRVHVESSVPLPAETSKVTDVTSAPAPLAQTLEEPTAQTTGTNPEPSRKPKSSIAAS